MDEQYTRKGKNISSAFVLWTSHIADFRSSNRDYKLVCDGLHVCRVFLRDIDSVATSARDRDLFRRTLRPPTTWRVCVGKLHAPALRPLWTHVGMRVSATGLSDPGGIKLLVRPNMQATAFRVGDLYVLALSGESDLGDIVQAWDWRTTPRARNLLWQLFPSVHREVPFGINEMQEADAEDFAMSFKIYMDDLARKTGYVVHPKFVEEDRH